MDTVAEARKQFVNVNVGYDEILNQLNEECAELILAVSKLRRSMSSKNPTPVTKEQALSMVEEELADVMLCLDILGFDTKTETIEKTKEKKLLRWVDRIVNGGSRFTAI